MSGECQTYRPACPKFSDNVVVTIYLNPLGSIPIIRCLTRCHQWPVGAQLVKGMRTVTYI